MPPLEEVAAGHQVACHFTSEVLTGEKEETGPYTGGGKVETRTEIIKQELMSRRVTDVRAGRKGS